MSTKFDELVDICADKGVTSVTAEETRKTRERRQKYSENSLISVLPPCRHEIKGARIGRRTAVVRRSNLSPISPSPARLLRAKRELARDFAGSYISESHYSFKKDLVGSPVCHVVETSVRRSKVCHQSSPNSPFINLTVGRRGGIFHYLRCNCDHR